LALITLTPYSNYMSRFAVLQLDYSESDRAWRSVTRTSNSSLCQGKDDIVALMGCLSRVRRRLF